eukprot:596304-Pyramimonas_sp.AAC.1
MDQAGGPPPSPELPLSFSEFAQPKHCLQSGCRQMHCGCRPGPSRASSCRSRRPRPRRARRTWCPLGNAAYNALDVAREDLSRSEHNHDNDER